MFIPSRLDYLCHGFCWTYLITTPQISSTIGLVCSKCFLPKNLGKWGPAGVDARGCGVPLGIMDASPFQLWEANRQTRATCFD